MQKDNNTKLELVTLLLKFYEVVEVKNIKYEKDCVYGSAIWNDITDEQNSQNFIWKININDERIITVKILMDYIYQNQKFRNDKILISDDEIVDIFKKENWDEKIIKQTISDMYNLEINMIDDEGNLNDAFYLHQ